MRLIVHAGFHKTGTSSVQHTLNANKSALSEEFRIYLREDLRPTCEAARAVSIANDPLAMGAVTYEWAQFLATIDPDDPRPIVISAEDLAGHMPGRHDLIRYGATPAIMATMSTVVSEYLPNYQPQLFFSTRAPAEWVQSCYGQHLRATRMTDDLATYHTKMMPHADLDTIVDAVSAAVPGVPVASARLEDSAKHALGPVSALLDLMRPNPDLRARLKAIAPRNRALPTETMAEFLRLNRSNMNRADLSRAKKALLP